MSRTGLSGLRRGGRGIRAAGRRGSQQRERIALLDGQVGLIQRIENRVSGIPTLLAAAREDLAAAQQTVADAGQRIGQPFRHAETLHDAERHLADLEAQLAELNDYAEPGQQDPTEEPLEARLTVETLHSSRSRIPQAAASKQQPSAKRARSAVRRAGAIYERRFAT